jgi:hypothetical protein
MFLNLKLSGPFLFIRLIMMILHIVSNVIATKILLFMFATIQVVSDLGVFICIKAGRVCLWLFFSLLHRISLFEIEKNCAMMKIDNAEGT